MAERLPHLISRLQGLGTTIFHEMTTLAVRHDAINLGQGFPDRDGPDIVREAAVSAIRAGHNQYAPGHGVAVLREAIAAHQRRFYGLAYDAEDEITVTAGATEAIAATVLALCEVGDEVIAFEPYYDSYAANIAMAGAVRRPVTLRPPDFALDVDMLRAAVTPRTRLVLLNSPHNPTGKVFTRAELEAVATVCREHDLLAVTDEVYEHLVYDGAHVPLATLEGMRDRTVTISSAGKTFSFTGWKVGWACAPPELTAALRTTKQFMTYTNGTPFQHAVAQALTLDDEFFADLVTSYRSRRDLLCDGLASVGLQVFRPAGSYFTTTDIRPLGHIDGLAFCRDLPARAGVAAVPCVVFYDDTEVGAPLVRFTFSKTPAVLEEGIARLRKLDREDSA